MNYTIDSVDVEKGHVTFTITTDDGTTHTDTRCDLHYKDEVVTKNEQGEEIAPYVVRVEVDPPEALAEYAKAFNADYMAAKAQQDARYGNLKPTK